MSVLAYATAISPRICAAGLALAFGLTACAKGTRDDPGKIFDMEVGDMERKAQESKTLSALAIIEAALKDYVSMEKRIPERLDQLMPKYLPTIPTISLGVPEHRESSSVTYYPSGAIEKGQVKASLLKDSGAWGYVFNESQVIIFVDCTHSSIQGRPWYQAKGPGGQVP